MHGVAGPWYAVWSGGGSHPGFVVGVTCQATSSSILCLLCGQWERRSAPSAQWTVKAVDRPQARLAVSAHGAYAILTGHRVHVPCAHGAATACSNGSEASSGKC
eukprot:2235925-Amphidinium_carterae.2